MDCLNKTCGVNGDGYCISRIEDECTHFIPEPEQPPVSDHYKKGYAYSNTMLTNDVKLYKMIKSGVVDADLIYDRIADAFVEGMKQNK